ncbi:DUF4253 domain-containing protein [Actinokineospora guangxiensis]|uniref:DUF4253 domain-containing protein n=1 Tax=Actinokineospora guangxiensis TaxID=1490288 RepID=A0ABW0EY47_9PSEU
MTSETPAPALRDLFPETAERHPPVAPLPPGRLVLPEEEDTERPAFWLSDGPAPAGLWAALRAEHGRTGLWPLLLDALDDDDEDYRPWGNGEVLPGDMSDPGAHAPAELLARWWSEHTAPAEDDALPEAERAAVTSPYGRSWPGAAGPRRLVVDPDRTADDLAAHLLAGHPTMRLGLVAADRGADALSTAGWTGPMNHFADTALLSSVLRDWEERYGARVVGVGFDTLVLSVAAPPTTHADALPVAAEHFALCPDNVWQGESPHTLFAYAQRLVGDHSWTFWWD